MEQKPGIQADMGRHITHHTLVDSDEYRRSSGFESVVSFLYYIMQKLEYSRS